MQMKIERAEHNRIIMEEEKERMENDLQQWKAEFIQQNDREPREEDK